MNLRVTAAVLIGIVVILASGVLGWSIRSRAVTSDKRETREQLTSLEGRLTDAREELAEFMGRPVHLFLRVALRENWLDEAERYTEMGLDFRDGN